MDEHTESLDSFKQELLDALLQQDSSCELVNHKSKMRFWTYFRRGYTLYFSMPVQLGTFAFVSLLSFKVFLLELLVLWFPILGGVSSILDQLITVGYVTVFPIAMLIGWKDYTSKRGAYRADATVECKNNPWNQSLILFLILDALGYKRQAVKMFSTWLNNDNKKTLRDIIENKL